MARPSMAAQRKEEILDALETCILQYGIQATSLESIAEAAGVKRTILRHYIGNRDDIICALSTRLRSRYSQQWQQLLCWLPSKNKTESIIDALFTVGSSERVNATIIGEAIFSEAKRLPPVKRDQEAIMDEFITIICQVLRDEYEHASDDKIELVAHGIYANYLLSESFLPLTLVDQVYKLKATSKLLCTTLT
ncbi:TetR/AcrR family transcriptional regulator [Pseudoalteromonas sp. McH1-42]|uniref:TetR/AcrR family transcriptional regulator n=1 Tax=Pseudoalteromonas sp. McH1-42 TaxID=2917752 RepID=UPI001EF4B17C|nr:TetR/AcrR family transcriptional regulator [Pseudoalteromonas sp. McH1-42]MCG7561096.1 TetR/AcrR family transcriptional regulator [Pseudoalteromonas sp. McH1-42]